MKIKVHRQRSTKDREIVGLGAELEYQKIRPTHFIGFHFFTMLKQKLFTAKMQGQNGKNSSETILI